MRAPDFGVFTLALLADVKRICQTETSRVFILPASGTGGWEAGVTNTLSPGDKVRARRFGQFSHLWGSLCERHGLDVEVVDRPWGEGAPVERYAEILAADRGHAIKAVLATHNETAAGVTSDVAAGRRALDDAGHPALLFVDGQLDRVPGVPHGQLGRRHRCCGLAEGAVYPQEMAAIGNERGPVHPADIDRNCDLSIEH